MTRKLHHPLASRSLEGLRGMQMARAAALREAVNVARREYRAAECLIAEDLRAHRNSVYRQGQRSAARAIYNELRRLK